MMSLWRTAVIACMVAACGDAGPRADAVVRDSAGITIIENQRPDSAGVAWWRIEQPAEFDVGGFDAPETHALFGVSAAARLSDGRIVVANSGTGDIRYYSADGAHLSSSGRRGGGPGEFQRITRIVTLPGDSLLVNDPGSRRASILDPQGVFARAVTGGTAAFPTITGRLGDGTFAGTVGINPGSGPTQLQSGLQRGTAAYVRVSPEGTVLDTITIAPGVERVLQINMSGGSITSVSISGIPFGKSTSHSSHNDRLYIGTQDTPEVSVYDTAGNLTHIIRTGAQLVPATEQRIAAHIERTTADLEPGVQQNVRENLRSSPVGEFLPAYGEIATDAAGNLWIADYDDPLGPTGEWNVFDTDGRLIARIRLPEGFTVYEIGNDYLLGLERDDLDTEHVRLYRLLKND